VEKDLQTTRRQSWHGEGASGIAEPTPIGGAHETLEPETLSPGIRMQRFTDVKRVVKRWGQERWLHEPGAPYGFKVIRIKAGHRTSLQLHERKRESYFILEGEAILHYRTALDAPTRQVPFGVGALAHVDPGAVHRVEAVTDIILIEASTHDDGSDNVRIEDDYGRGNGRIGVEH
jgi:mannose-6-phosphate isomerase